MIYELWLFNFEYDIDMLIGVFYHMSVILLAGFLIYTLRHK